MWRKGKSSEHSYGSLNEERLMAWYWERGSGGKGLEVQRLVLFGSTTAGLGRHERQSRLLFGESFFLWMNCFLVLLLKPSCFYKSCPSLFAETGAVVYTVSDHCNYWVGLAFMVHTLAYDIQSSCLEYIYANTKALKEMYFPVFLWLGWYWPILPNKPSLSGSCATCFLYSVGS